MDAYRFNGCHHGRLAALSIILGCSFWFLGNTYSSALAADRITGAEAIAKMSLVLGSPEQFADNMKNWLSRT